MAPAVHLLHVVWAVGAARPRAPLRGLRILARHTHDKVAAHGGDCTATTREAVVTPYDAWHRQSFGSSALLTRLMGDMQLSVICNRGHPFVWGVFAYRPEWTRLAHGEAADKWTAMRMAQEEACREA